MRVLKVAIPGLLFAVLLMVCFCGPSAEPLATSPTGKERALGVEVVKSRGDDCVQYPTHFGILYESKKGKDGLLPPSAWWVGHLPHPETISLGDCRSP